MKENIVHYKKKGKVTSNKIKQITDNIKSFIM